MTPRSLLSPLVHSDPGGITLLTGANVALAPERLAAAMLRLAGPARRRFDDEVDLVAFMATRSGIAGCRGVLGRETDGMTLGDVEAFGTESSITAFGGAFGTLLLEGGRFSEVPRIRVATGPVSLSWLADGLSAAGVDLVSEAAAPCMG